MPRFEDLFPPITDTPSMESLVGEHVKEATARLGIRKLLLDTPVAMPERLTEMVKLKQLFDEEYVRQLASMDTQ